MSTGEKVLVVGGVFALAISFVLGFILSRNRLKDPSADQRFLLSAHELALFEGVMMLGLVFAVRLSNLSNALETVAASLIVSSAAFQIGAAVSNWRGGVRDQFAERSFGFKLAAINSVLAASGLVIIIVGVVRAL